MSPIKDFIGFEEITWEELAGCKKLVEPAHAFPLVSRTATWNKNNPAHIGRCMSLPIKVSGNSVRIEYAGFSNSARPGEVRVELHNSSNKLLATLPFPHIKTGGVWHLLEVPLPINTNSITLTLIDNEPEAGWGAVRNRVNFYNENIFLTNLQNIFQKSLIKNTLLGILSLSLLAIIATFSSLRHNNFKLFSLFFCLVTLIHFRTDVFFHMDEWHVLQRLVEQGFSSAFLPHNEHFAPFFFIIYFIECYVFGSNYHLFILFSLLLHSFNALLVYHLIKKLQKNDNLVPYFLSLLFLLSGLHGESLQWAMIQPILLMTTGILFSLLGVVKSSRYLLISGLIISPLSFGAGLLAPIYIGLLALIRKNKSAMYISIIAFLVTSIGYYLILNLDGHPQGAPLQNNFSLFPYLQFVSLGTFFGTISRGLGLLPITELSNLSFSTALITGIIVTCVIALPAFRNPKYFIFGFIFILLSFALIGLGRAEFGSGQALALRYNSFAMVGLCIMLIPFTELLFNKKLTLGFLAVVIIFSQLTLAVNFNNYPKNGFHLRGFIKELEHWNKTKPSGSSFEATNTPLAGLMPLRYGGHPKFPAAQVPIVHPNKMMILLRNLDD